MLQRFVADLSPADYLHRISPEANCAAWIIGHLVLSERNVMKRLGLNLPQLPEGFEKQFSRDAGCPQANEFGDVTKLMPMFNEHRTMLIDAIKKATPQQLDQPLDKPFPLFNTVGELANFYGAHTAMHAGHISLIRRHLGRPPVV
jgi:DinB superfamily